MSDRLVCQGDGDYVSEDGWLRLAYVMGAGDQVERKQFRIGIKNHGLKACFRLGDNIILRSDGQQMIQTLYKNGDSSHPSPGTFREPIADPDAPPTGCAVEVPYRQQKLVVMKGEALTLDVPNDDFLEDLFRTACNSLSTRLLGVVRPGIRDKYTLHLNHHALGTVKLHWVAKRGRNITGRGQKRFLIFRRECDTVSDVDAIRSSTIYEQACTFRIPFRPGKRPEIPDFFARDKRSFFGEISWFTSKSGSPRSTVGVRRYPIAYDTTSDSALTGVGVHYSAPFISDAERHGVSQIDARNSHIDDACKDALVEIMGSYLLHRHGPKAMDLYLADDTRPKHDVLRDLLKRTIDKQMLPIEGGTVRGKRGSRRLSLGPRKRSPDGLCRVVLPVYTWDRGSISPLLAKICPRDEDQIDATVPSTLLECLSDCSYSSEAEFSDIPITFDELDAIQRLQPLVDAHHFPWKDESDWRAALGSSAICSAYLQVVYETIINGGFESESAVAERAYVATSESTAQPLAELYSAVSLPPSLGPGIHVTILHPDLHNHRLLRRPAWKPSPFTLDDFLDHAHLETASSDDRQLFWMWLRTDWKSVKRRTIIRLTSLPVWPSTNGDLVTLKSLCDPSNARVASILGDAIVRPSPNIARAGIVRKTARGPISFRRVPTREEVERFLFARLATFPRDEQLTGDQKQAFHRFENDLEILAKSDPQLRKHLIDLSEKYGIALARDGSLKTPMDLVRDDGRYERLCLLDRHVIDRPRRFLDRLDGWAPMAGVSVRQIVEVLDEDRLRHEAHIPRLAEYVKQARRENASTTALSNVAFIPVKGQFRSPDQLAFRGPQDFWGDWKIEIPTSDVSSEVQRLYRTVGVVGGSPNSASSRLFFEWLASQPPETIGKHTDQALRHINHKLGPNAWHDAFPTVPFIPVESTSGSILLVTKSEALKRGSRVVIPDFAALEAAIRQDIASRPVEIAIVQSHNVREAITPRLRQLGLRTLSGVAGAPVKVVGLGREGSVQHSEFRDVLQSLQSGLKGKQLQKRLSQLDLDTRVHPLRSNWRQQLAYVRQVRTADQVTATYTLRRRRFSVDVDAKLDRNSGTLWIKSDIDHRTAFFDVIADQIFEDPKKYFGLILDKAYRMDFQDRNREERDDEVEPADNDFAQEPGIEEGVSTTPWATSGVHSGPGRQRPSNLPDPGPIPSVDGTVGVVPGSGRRRKRSSPADEKLQIENLKSKQYAWHCQVCITGMAPRELAPSSSYVERSENRRRIIDAHHCDQVEAGGARHAGNIVLLCHYHHLELGDAITRSDITRSLDQAGTRTLMFRSERGVSRHVDGWVVTIHPPQRQDAVSLFFTKEHADYWLTEAPRSEGSNSA